jgi:hypothetical protein
MFWKIKVVALSIQNCLVTEVSYPVMRPYLKGINLTIDQWRSGCDVEGWKYMNWYEDYLVLDDSGGREKRPRSFDSGPSSSMGLGGSEGVVRSRFTGSAYHQAECAN